MSTFSSMTRPENAPSACHMPKFTPPSGKNWLVEVIKHDAVGVAIKKALIYIPDLLTVHGDSFMHIHLDSMAARPLGQLENTAAIVSFLKICFES